MNEEEKKLNMDGLTLEEKLIWLQSCIESERDQYGSAVKYLPRDDRSQIIGEALEYIEEKEAALAALRAEKEELEKVNQEVWERLDVKDRAELNCKWKAEGRLKPPPPAATQEPADEGE